MSLSLVRSRSTLWAREFEFYAFKSDANHKQKHAQEYIFIRCPFADLFRTAPFPKIRGEYSTKRVLFKNLIETGVLSSKSTAPYLFKTQSN